MHELTGGISRRTFLVHLAGGGPTSVVVRVIADREVATREAAALDVVDGTPVPAPRLVALRELPGLGWGLVCTRVPGRPSARPNEAAWLDELASTLATIHEIRPSGRSLPVDPGSSRSWLDEDAEALGLGPMGAGVLEAVRRRRHELDQAPHVLVHGDFRPGNVHWSRGRVAGVLDWETARWGPAAADVAYLHMDLVLAAGRAAADGVLEAYERRSGPVHAFDAWLALACLRPLPDPAAWLPAWEAAGYRTLTPTLVRGRLRRLVQALA